MKNKEKNIKVAGQNRAIKMAVMYPCASNGTRRPCTNHCKKCFFEIMYCSS